MYLVCSQGILFYIPERLLTEYMILRKEIISNSDKYQGIRSKLKKEKEQKEIAL